MDRHDYKRHKKRMLRFTQKNPWNSISALNAQIKLLLDTIYTTQIKLHYTFLTQSKKSYSLNFIADVTAT